MIAIQADATSYSNSLTDGTNWGTTGSGGTVTWPLHISVSSGQFRAERPPDSFTYTGNKKWYMEVEYTITSGSPNVDMGIGSSTSYAYYASYRPSSNSFNVGLQSWGVVSGLSTSFKTGTHKLKWLNNGTHSWIYIDDTLIQEHDFVYPSSPVYPWLMVEEPAGAVTFANLYYDDNCQMPVTVTHDPCYLWIHAEDMATKNLLYNVGYNITNVNLGTSEYGYFDQWVYREIETNYTYEYSLNCTYYVDWGPLTIVSDYNTLPGYEWNVTAHMGRAVEDPVNQSYTKIYFEDQDDNTVDTAWLRITNDDGIMVLDRYVGSYWYIALNRSETYTFEAWDTLAKHQGATRTLQIPDADQTDVPMVLNKLDTTVDTSYIGLYKDGIDESMQGIRDGMNDTFSSVYGIMDNYTVQIEYVSDNMTAANGTIAGYTTTINAFGTIINSIPGKVQFLITYYLICLLVLVLLNR